MKIILPQPLPLVLPLDQNYVHQHLLVLLFSRLLDFLAIVDPSS
jgi:hypothetical protein